MPYTSRRKEAVLTIDGQTVNKHEALLRTETSRMRLASSCMECDVAVQALNVHGDMIPHIN